MLRAGELEAAAGHSRKRDEPRCDAYGNAVAETFFATLKKELINRRSWHARLELQSAVFEYIEAFYNRQRRHSTLGMLSPIAYEQLRLSPLGS